MCIKRSETLAVEEHRAARPKGMDATACELPLASSRLGTRGGRPLRLKPRACPAGGRRGETSPWHGAHATVRRGVSPRPSGASQRCSISPANGYDPVASSLVDDPPTSSPSMQMSLHPVRFPWSRWDDPSVWVARARSPTRGDATEVMRYQGLCGRAGTRARPLPSQSKARTRGVEVAAGNNPRDQSNAGAGHWGERSEPSGEVSP
jgi:hypothetical protein